MKLIGHLKSKAKLVSSFSEHDAVPGFVYSIIILINNGSRLNV